MFLETVQYSDSAPDFAQLLTAYLAAVVLVELLGIFSLALHCLHNIF